MLARQIETRETAYSRPLAYKAFIKEPMERNGKPVRDFARLKFGGAHLADPDAQWAGDVTAKVARPVSPAALAVAALAVLLAAFLMRRSHDGTRGALRDIAADRTHIPVRAGLATFAVVCLIAGPVIALAGSYHVLGTDRTGNDVLYQSLKSVRTAFVIGTLATMATLPFAIVLGVLAGYFKGWVDEAIQYVYTTLTSVPNVLLIAACVLMVQVYLDTARRDVRDRLGALRPEDLPALRDPRPHRLGDAVPPDPRRDAEAARARFRAGRDRLRRQPGQDHGAPHRART